MQERNFMHSCKVNGQHKHSSSNIFTGFFVVVCNSCNPDREYELGNPAVDVELNGCARIVKMITCNLLVASESAALIWNIINDPPLLLKGSAGETGEGLKFENDGIQKQHPETSTQQENHLPAMRGIETAIRSISPAELLG
jgi:hypothetical protein